MSDAPEAPKPKKKGGLVKKLVVFGVLPLVLVGGGVGGGLYAARSMGGGHEAPKEDPNRPKLMKKVEGESAGGGEGGGHGEGGGEAAAPKGEPLEGPAPRHIDPAYFQATYFAMEQPFTSNLRDTDGFLQVGIGVSTFYDSRVIEHLKQAQMPVRSAILETLAAQSAEQLNTPQGKEQLRLQLKAAINRVLTEQSGFGGIEGVYYTSFVIQ